jgi:GntR family transcriptional regulator
LLDEKLPVSLYHQLKEILFTKINGNEWPVDSKIPTERQLCEMYKVSRITVRQALDELEKEGYLYRKQGKGTFVTTPKIEQRLSCFYSFSEEIKKMGFTPGAEILKFFIEAAGEEVAERLQIDKDAQVYSIKRLRLANNEPFAVETSYVPCDCCPGLKSEEISKNGLYNTMKNKYGVIPYEAMEVFEAVIIGKEDACYLRTGKTSPGIQLERLTSAGERPIEYCKSIIRGDRYKYKVVLR